MAWKELEKIGRKEWKGKLKTARKEKAKDEGFKDAERVKVKGECSAGG